MSERLTEKGGMSLFQFTENVKQNKAVECYNKLSELEDIEEELGIDLITFLSDIEIKKFASDYVEKENSTNEYIRRLREEGLL